MPTHPQPVPSFKNPPVVEVVWSVQFAKLPWLTAAHTGLYWQDIREGYPQCQEHPPIQHTEEPEKLLLPKSPAIELQAKPPLCRQWFISERGTDLVQLQADRFCINWRKAKTSDVYPRYEYMKNEFTTRWAHFCCFAEKYGNESPRVNQCEMTYVNHVYQGEGWSTPDEIGKVFPGFSWLRERDFLGSVAAISSQMIFDMKGRGGRLYASCRQARSVIDEERDLFQFNLIARGKPDETTQDGLLNWFADAREWIVRGFADLTDPGVQTSLWERER